jgi:hypothetical protein
MDIHPLSEGDHGCVHGTEGEVGVLPDQLSHPSDIGRRNRQQFQPADRHHVQELCLCLRPAELLQ